MHPTLTTRKPVDGLTPEDVAAYPVWAFAEDGEQSEGRDETWVRPLSSQEPLSRSSPVAIRAQIIIKSGAEMTGVVWLSTQPEMQVQSAALFVAGSYVPIQRRGAPFAEMTRASASSALGVPVGAIFPVRYAFSVTGDHGPVEGEGEIA